MKRLIAQADSELGPLLDYVHDRPYKLSAISLDRNTGDLTIQVELGRSTCLGTLVIHGVHEFEIKDEAQIGEGDINIISIAEDRVVIRGALPVDLIATGHNLEVELQLPDDAPPA